MSMRRRRSQSGGARRSMRSNRRYEVSTTQVMPGRRGTRRGLDLWRCEEGIVMVSVETWHGGGGRRRQLRSGSKFEGRSKAWVSK